MGFFSWRTQDTDESIPNTYSGVGTIPVTMYDNKGNKWEEEDYEGYGVFGGKDYYELVAEMNGFTEADLERFGKNELRLIGIGLGFEPEKFGKKKEDIIFPNLVHSSGYAYAWSWINKKPESCEYQGYFYPEEWPIYDEE